LVSAIATTSVATTASNVNCTGKTSTKGTTSKSGKFSSFLDNINKANEKAPDTSTSASDTSNAKSDSNSTAKDLVKELKSTFTDVSACPKCGAIYVGKNPPAVCTKCGTSIEQHINGKGTDETKDAKTGNTDSNIQSAQLETDTSNSLSNSAK